jgi:hypothetical protein
LGGGAGAGVAREGRARGQGVGRPGRAAEAAATAEAHGARSRRRHAAGPPRHRIRRRTARAAAAPVGGQPGHACRARRRAAAAPPAARAARAPRPRAAAPRPRTDDLERHAIQLHGQAGLEVVGRHGRSAHDDSRGARQPGLARRSGRMGTRREAGQMRAANRSPSRGARAPRPPPRRPHRRRPHRRPREGRGLGPQAARHIGRCESRSRFCAQRRPERGRPPALGGREHPVVLLHAPLKRGAGGRVRDAASSYTSRPGAGAERGRRGAGAG